MQWGNCVCTVGNCEHVCAAWQDTLNIVTHGWLLLKLFPLFCSRRFCKTYNYKLANTFYENDSVTIHKCEVKQKEICIGPINLFCFKKIHFRVCKLLMSIAFS